MHCDDYEMLEFSTDLRVFPSCFCCIVCFCTYIIALHVICEVPLVHDT